MSDKLPDSEEKLTRDKRLVDFALGSMTIDNIRELVREMEEELKKTGTG